MRQACQEDTQATLYTRGEAMTDQEQVISILQNLKSVLQTSATVLSRQGPTLQGHAEELEGASRMVQSWIDGITEEGVET